MTSLDERIAALPDHRRAALEALLRQRRAAAAPAITRDDSGTPAPLSVAQWQFWFLWSQEPGSGLYNVPMVLRLRGPLDPDAVRSALRAVVERHEVLRTCYPLADGAEEPTPVALPADGFRLETVELPDDAPDRAALAREAAIRFAGEGFDLATSMPTRALLVRIGEDDHLLALVVHHIATDGASIEILFGEFAEAYQALREDRPALLPHLPVRYSDFARWQRSTTAGERLTAGVEFWRSWLEDANTVLDLPTDRPRPAVPSGRGGMRRRRFGQALTERVTKFANQENVTPFMVLLAGLGVVLRRYTGKDDFLVGTPAANRPTPETEPLVGCFANTLVLRVRVDGDATVRELLARVRADASASYDHQDVPFERVVAAARPERAAARNPLFQVMFVHQRSQGAAALSELGVERVDVHNDTAKFDLDVSLIERPDGIDASCEYDAEIFGEARIDRLLGHLEQVLTAMTGAPDATVAALEVLTDSEHEAAARTWNATEEEFPAADTLTGLFDQRRAAAPESVAVATATSAVTYEELGGRVAALAGRLRAGGVGPNDVVGVAVRRTGDLPEALLAVLATGAGYLPLDPGNPADRLRLMVADARTKLVLTTSEVAPLLPDTGTPVLLLDAPSEPGMPSEPDMSGAPGPGPENLCYVIYTSGSTGRPKGVLLDQRGRVNNFTDFNRRFAIGRGDAVLSVSSLGFDMTAYDVLGTLSGGSTLVLPDQERDRDPGHWLDLMASHRVTVWHSVPALLGLLLDAADDLGVTELPHLRVVLLGGDWIPLGLADRLRRLAPQAQVISLGGATEVSMDSTIFPIGEVDPDWRSIPYGSPMANQLAYVLDVDGHLAPIGVPGELYLGGIGLAWGYAGAPEQTADRFVPDPFGPRPGARMYRTGDLARYREDGVLELLGRVDFQVKIAGNRIELGEVEAALREQPEVAEVVTAAPPVDGQRVLVGYVVAADGVVIDQEDLRRRLRVRLPEYMVPAVLVQLDAVPLTPNGKVDRGRLPVPDGGTPVAAGGGRRPGTPTELALAEVWADLLGRPDVSADEGFFTLGGDSVASIRMVTRARAVGLELSPKMVFQHQTITELATAVDAAGRQARDGRTATSDHDGLSPIQRHMLAEQRRNPVPGRYVIQSAFPLPGDLDETAFAAAWRWLVRRHDVLRTAYSGSDTDHPVPVIAPEADLDLGVTDLRGLDAHEQRDRVLAELADVRAAGFDLAVAPLVRVHRYLLADELQLLVQHHHYSVLDGWSCMQLRRELLVAYQAFATGTEPDLPEPVPFARHLDALASYDRASAVGFWNRYLDGSTGPWADEPVTPDHAVLRLTHALDAPLLTAVDELARKSGLSFAALAQLAWAALLARRGGVDDVVFGVTLAGRSVTGGVDSSVGPFISTVPLRCRFDTGATVLEAARRLQLDRLDAEEHSVVELAAMTGSRPLGSVLVFDNYPVDDSLRAVAPDQGLTHPLLAEDLGLAQTEFPVRVDVLRGAEDLVAVTFAPEHPLPPDPGEFGPALTALLRQIVAAPHAPVVDLLDRSAL